MSAATDDRLLGLYDLHATPQARPSKPRPSVLGVFLDDVQALQELAPGDRERVVEALSNLSMFSKKVLTCPEVAP